MPLIVGSGLVFLLCLAVVASVFATLDRKGALMSEAGLGTLSFLLLVGLVLYVAGGGGI
jgi:hypothetical protein